MTTRHTTVSDLPPQPPDHKQYQHQLYLRAKSTEKENRARNPFDSPNLSSSSVNETDSGSTSGLDEFHLERYSSDAKYKHARNISRSTNSDEKHRPDLNIITSFATPNMPMNSEAVKINEVQAKQVTTDRRVKALSVVSHKAVQSTASPPHRDGSSQVLTSRSRKKQSATKSPKRSKPIHRLQNAVLQRQRSPSTQRVPIGITIPQTHAVAVDQNADSALSMPTPITPAIVVTPAGEQVPWVLQRRGTNEKDSASSTYSALPSGKFKHGVGIPPTPRTAKLENVYMTEKEGHYGLRTSQDSSELILSDRLEAVRPDSQGWWNLMLSPLLRAGSLANRKTRQPTDTPPVPPLPFSKEKVDSPALSVRSDPSFQVSPHETDPSPDTPRRQGLASARGSTWSRWSEWENEREIGRQVEDDSTVDRQDPEAAAEDSSQMPASKGTGLAAEYFHACAVEQLTGEPYFECVNHSCVEQLPRLQSIHDLDKTKTSALGSPFDEGRGRDLVADIKSPDGKDAARSPSVVSDTLSPNELSPNVRQASVVPMVKPRALDSGSDRGSQTRNFEVHIPASQDKAPSPIVPPAYATTQNNDDMPNIAAVTQPNPPPPQLIEIKVTQQTPPAPAPFEPPSEKAPPDQEPLSGEIASCPEYLPERAAVSNDQLASPGPISPEGQKSLAFPGAVPLSTIDRETYPAPVVFSNYATHGHMPDRPAFISAETEYPPLPERAPTAPVTAQDLAMGSRRLSIEERRQRLEKEDAVTKKVGGFWRGRGCFPKNGCFGRGGPEGRTKRRWIIGISFALLIIIIVSIVLAVTLTRRGDGTPVESQWLNLTGFPAMPTGIMTIAAPNMVAQQKQCISPTTMWSCAVPKEDRNEIGGNDPDQPNFRFEITFRNGTVPSNMTIPVNKLEGRASNPFTNSVFVPNPSPPNQADQIFMGNTTDNITAPFNGENTPFYITFMPIFPTIPDGFNDYSTKRLVRRQSNSSLLDAIPAPELAADGSAAPASLLPTTPFPISQPIRLYNRGLQDEHYGFYMYYEKSIYLSGFHIDANGLVDGSQDPADADQDGGSTKTTATARCSFAQTRFLFKIFTNAAFDGELLSGPSSENSTDLSEVKKQQSANSATNFVQPGSFPYPASVVLDRHGGDIDTKAVWCYGMSGGGIVKDHKIIVGEDRSVGGSLINGVPSLLGNSTSFNRTAGGIDGGTGGCSCLWQNWQ